MKSEHLPTARGSHTVNFALVPGLHNLQMVSSTEFRYRLHILPFPFCNKSYGEVSTPGFDTVRLDALSHVQETAGV